MQENSLSKFDQKLGLTVSFVSLLVSSLLIVGATMESGGDTVTVLPMLIVFILAGFSLIWYLLRRYRLSNQAYAVDHLNLSIQRWILGFFMVHYGLPKIFGNFFDYQLFALDRPMALASEFEIAWYMFGKNPWHEMFAGVMEFIPGLMLFNRRTYYLGAIILLPVVGQVLIINTFFGIGVFTLAFAIMLMVCNLYIVYSQKSAIQGFIKNLSKPTTPQWSKREELGLKGLKWLTLAFLAYLITIRCYHEVKNILSPSAYEQLVGVYTLESVTKNKQAHNPQNQDRYYKDLYFERQARWNILRRSNNETAAFLVELKADDGITLMINKGGIGDRPDEPDRKSAFEGTYTLEGEQLTLAGKQLGDQLTLVYRRRPLQPKKWFW